MNDIAQLVKQFEALGGSLLVNGSELRYRISGNAGSHHLLKIIHEQKEEVLRYLTIRDSQMEGLSNATYQPDQSASIPRQLIPIWRQMNNGQYGVGDTNMPCALQLAGQLNPEALAASVTALYERYPVLSSDIRIIDGREHFVPVPNRKPELHVSDAKSQPASVIEDALYHASWTSFDWNRVNLLRVFAIDISKVSHIVGFVLHHFIGDAVTLNILRRDFAYYYNTYRNLSSPEAGIFSLDYLVYLRELDLWMGTPEAEISRSYWVNQFSAIPAIVSLPPVKSYDERGMSEFHDVSFDLSGNLLSEINDIAKRHRTLPIVVLISAHEICMGELSRHSVTALLLISSGRWQSDMFHTVGRLTRNTPIFSQHRKGYSTSEILNKTHMSYIGGLKNERYPYELALDRLAPDGTFNYPLFNYIPLRYEDESQNTSAMGTEIPIYVPPPPQYVRSTPHRSPTHYFEITERQSGASGRISYLSSLFDDDIMERFVSRFIVVLHEIVGLQKL